MKRRFFWLPLLLLAAPAGAATDYQTTLYLQKLNNYYYCLSREGLKSFQCDAVATLSGQEPEGLNQDWAGFDWRNSRCAYTFSYLGGEVMPILGFASDGGDPQATAARMRKITNEANELLLIWGQFHLFPQYDPDSKWSTVTIEKNPGAYFSLVSRARGMTITVDYDDQALAQKITVRNRALTDEVKLWFVHLPQGAVLQHLEMDIRGRGKPVNIDLFVRYQDVQGFQLPSVFTFFVRTPGMLFQSDYQMSNYEVLRKGQALSGGDHGDTEVVPTSAENPGARHFLWKVQSGTATVYLLGSIHIRPNAPLQVPEIVEKSFEASDFVAFEYDRSKLEEIEKQQDDWFDAHCTYPEGDSLMNHTTPQEWAKIRFLLRLMGISQDLALRYKPYILQELAAHRPLPKGAVRMKDKGIDEIFYRKALALKKKVFGLEYWYEGYKVLDTLSDHDQVHFLLGDSTAAHNHVRFFGEILADWKCGNTVDLDSLVNTDVAPEDARIMGDIVQERNRLWVGQLDRILQTRATCFIIVGSAHLVGDAGLPSLLRQKGYSVEQL